MGYLTSSNVYLPLLEVETVKRSLRIAQRQTCRKYTLPENVLVNMVASSLSPDGVLTIEAPKKPVEPPQPTQRDVPIRKTDEPSKV
ncbi:protein lethal(2)essential for life-like [Procambarus clarkii]|uniref:protein lethal(2)essential for life-like n=1 Tax=Procambarus clarkii TaxID=6728 RepID=UPI0037427306